MPFDYHCRPGYGSQELLIEFSRGAEDPAFYPALYEAMAPLLPTLKEVNELWMNDERILQMDSAQGTFDIHHDNWDMLFIMATNNQPAILAIDALLQQHPLFKKVAVDFSSYTLPAQTPHNPQ